MGKWRLRIGYGVADLACTLIFSMVASYLMIFYTDVSGISAAVAGTMMFDTRITEGFMDILAGLIVDRTNTRWGRNRPFFLFGAIPLGLITIAVFYAPPLQGNWKIVYAFVSYVILSFIYAIVNIPLSSILPTLTSDSKERTVLVTTRMIFSMIAATIITTFTTPLVRHFGNDDPGRGYLSTITIYATIAVILFFVTFKNTEEKIQPAAKGKKSSVKKDFQSLNSQCLVMFLFGLLYFSMFNIRSTSVIYYFTYNLEKIELIPTIGILGTFSGLPVLLLLPYITGKIGKRNAVITGAVIYILGTLTIWFAQSTTPILMCGLVATGCGMYLIQATFFTICPDVIDYCEYTSGQSIAGMITACSGFLSNIAMGASSSLLGHLLKAGGYVANQKQTASALRSIQISFIWVPIALCLAIIVLMQFYKLDRRMPEVQKELARRRGLSKKAPAQMPDIIKQ